MPHILIADDEASIRTILGRAIEKMGFTVLKADTGDKALDILHHHDIDVALLDIRMPSLGGLEILKHQNEFPSHPVLIIMTAQDTMDNAITAMKNGAYDYITKPFDLDEISMILKRALETKELKEENQILKTLGPVDTQPKVLICGKSKSIRDLYKIIGRVADQDVTVMITGESGTGKELVARAIHFNGKRASSPFVAVNCSAIPRDLLESELFGYKKGSFTGADRDHAGYFEQAHLGTLFLDEIGDMPKALQAKLLRVLQEGEIRRLGDEKTKAVNVRVIAATNVELKAQVKKGHFREDLFFRLNVVPVELAPLRDRTEDIPILLDHFIKLNHKLNPSVKGVTRAALQFLKQFPWPGNIRELENVIKRVLVLTNSTYLEKRDFEIFMTQDAHVLSVMWESLPLEEILEKRIVEQLEKMDDNTHNLYAQMIAMLEKPLLQAVLKKTGGNQIQASKILGINRNTLHKKMMELHLESLKNG